VFASDYVYKGVIMEKDGKVLEVYDSKERELRRLLSPLSQEQYFELRDDLNWDNKRIDYDNVKRYLDGKK